MPMPKAMSTRLTHGGRNARVISPTTTPPIAIFKCVGICPYLVPGGLGCLHDHCPPSWHPWMVNGPRAGRVPARLRGEIGSVPSGTQAGVEDEAEEGCHDGGALRDRGDRLLGGLP